MKRKRFLALLVCVAIFIVGIGIATGVDCSFGKVTVQDIYFTSNVDGALLHGRLYLPDNATAETPAPAVVFAQGNDADGEKYSMVSVELSRRGYVVFAVDLRGQGNSEGKTGFNATWVNDGLDSLGVGEAAEYVRGLSVVDKDEITIGGHSLGGVAAVRAAYSNPDWYKGVLLMGIATYDFGVPVDNAGDNAKWASSTKLLPYIDDEDNMNICLITGRDDGDAKDHTGVAAFCGLSDPEEFVSGQVYGSYENNNARINYQAMDAVHNMEYLNVGILKTCIDFVQNVSEAPNYIEAGSQIWQWRYIGTAVAMFAVLFMLLPLGDLLLSTEFFGSIRRDVPEYRGGTGGRWWLFAVITAIVGPLTYFHFSNWAVNWVPIRIWNVQRATCTLGWVLGVAGITLILMIVLRLFTKKESRPGLVNYGLTYERDSWLKNLGKTLLLAVLIVMAIYALLSVQYKWTHVDTRLWNISFRVLNGTRVIRWIKYFIPLAIAFVIISSNVFGSIRAKHGQISVLKEILINIAILAPWYLVWAIWFGPFAWLKSSGTLPSFAGMMYTFFWSTPLTMAIFAVITTYFNRRTGRVYLGAILSALVVSWYLVGGFSMLLA